MVKQQEQVHDHELLSRKKKLRGNLAAAETRRR